ncbi:MAG: S-layer homology domain-containing protein [Flintibacter sp.]|uniref:S-layer homology domain-containing protein n=1 Tax=Flintibacter sp. TaxID=1918624 RepID=UPI002D7F7556|nr:S-layer homology domain-containing protein [Flintibacter sp.]MCI7159157.1 S-layer homology domain-containing protein [Flintibacter sp.]
MKRRIIAALMCLCMLVGLLPMSAFAAPAEPGTVTATKEVVSQTPDENGNYTIKLTVQGEPVKIPSASAADVVLVVDNSGSMASSVGEPCLTPKSEFESKLTFLWYRYTCPNCGARYSSSLLEILWDTRPDFCTGQKGAEPRIDTAKNVSKTFAQSILKSENANQLAVIGFAHKSENGGPNDADALFVTQPLTDALTKINNKIDKMDADGGTNYSAALQQAYTWLNGREDKSRPAYVIFISDGAPGLSGESIGDSQWDGSNQAAALKRDGVTLYTIGIALTDDESNYLESLATDFNHYINVTGTNYATQLEKVLLEWASHINSVPAGKNAVMTDVVNADYFEVVESSLPTGVTLGSNGKTLTWNIGNIPKDGVSVEFKIKPKDSFLNSFTGTQTVYTNTNVSLKYKDYKDIDQTIPKDQIGDPTVMLTGTKPAEYTLTYNGNAQSGGTVDNMPTDNNTYLIGVTVPLSGQVPTYTAADGTTKVLFVGWTETENTKIYGKNDTAPTTVTSVTMAEGGKTVYAAWGYDANGNGTADATEVNVTFGAGAHGTLKGKSTTTVAKGGKLSSSQIPSVSADTNYTFTGWESSVDGKVYTNDALLTLAIDQATTFTARYEYHDPGQGGIHYDHHLYYHSNFGKDQKANESTKKDKVVVQDYEKLQILPERDGYVFVSWNTEKDGSGTRYLPGAVFALTKSEHHLYAQWQKDKTGPDDSGVSNWLETDDHKAYLTGYPDSTFRADRNMTRAEVAQMFYALLLDKNVTITKSFSDVPDDAWYATAVKTLASLGMMDGYPDGTFRPDEPITRAEFATVGLAFAYDPLDASCSYYDVGANAWYYTYVAQATTYGWIGGYPDNTFRPGNNITRVEVCVIVNNMLGRDADERYIDRHEDELVHFVDLSDSYWGYYTIMEATNTHEYTGSFTNEKWTDVK